MKKIALAAMLILSTAAALHAQDAATPLPKGHPAIPPQEAAATLSGRVLKTMDSGGYTYVYLQQPKGKKVWVAVPKTKIAAGKKAAFIPGPVMKNFESKTLKRTFPSIIFSAGLISGKGGQKRTDGKAPAVAGPGSKGSAVAAEKVKVSRAAGPNARSVAEIFAQSGDLNGKKVAVKGKVVKVTQGIMKMNWLHIQDGTGSPGKKDQDLVVTTKALPKTGETVTATGTVLKDKDFGYGYKYEVLIDNAEIAR